MEFSKKEIPTSVLSQSKYSQITVDDDFTIPDSKGDMEKIVAKEGHILLESMIPEDGKVRITGSVCVRVLYRTGGDIPRLCQFQSEIPFEDVVNCDGVSSSSQVDCHSQLEDLTVSMINSRKLKRCASMRRQGLSRGKALPVSIATLHIVRSCSPSAMS